jgi:crossover junction endodeoxyribonuclease RuvC
VVDIHAGRRVSLVYAAVARTPKDAELGERLQQVEDAILGVIAECSPTAIAVEQVFSQHNVRTINPQAAGVACLITARQGIPMAFTPSEVKAAVTGSGRAEKQQVATMVARIVGRPVPGPADLTDAVALAICHGWRFPAQQRLARALAVGGEKAVVSR